MRRKRLPVILLCIFESRALPMISSSMARIEEPRQLLSSELPSLLQLSDAGTPTISSISAITSMPTESNAILQLSMVGPMIAAVLVGIVVISAAVVICFLRRQPKRTYRRRRSFEAPFIPRHDSHSQRSGLLRDEIPSENHPRKKKYRRHSRHSGGTVELDASQDGNRPKASKMPLRLGNRQCSGSTNSTFSLALNMKKMGVDHHIVDRSQTLATIVPSTVSSNQVDPRPTIEPPLLSSQNEPMHPSNHINPASLPEVERHPLIQQRATAGNTSDKSVNGELSVLLLEGQDLSLTQPDTPPPYEPER